MLEDALQVRLFHRTTRTVSLTEDGPSILAHVESLLTDFQALENRFEKNSELSGTIRLTTLDNLATRLLAPITQRFCDKHPKVKLELLTTDHFLDLVEERIDIAVRIQGPKDSSFTARKIGPNELIFCASPAYLKTAKAPLAKPQDLAKHRVLLLPVHKSVAFVPFDLLPLLGRF